MTVIISIGRIAVIEHEIRMKDQISNVVSRVCMFMNINRNYDVSKYPTIYI